jgi:hypothetical protein
MSEGTTRRTFLQRAAFAVGAAAAAASGLPVFSSRGDLLNQLIQHLDEIGYTVLRYSKF